MEEAVEMSQDKKDLDDEIVGRVNHLNESILSLEEDLGHKVSMSELSAYLQQPIIAKFIRVLSPKLWGTRPSR